MYAVWCLSFTGQWSGSGSAHRDERMLCCNRPDLRRHREDLNPGWGMQEASCEPGEPTTTTWWERNYKQCLWGNMTSFSNKRVNWNRKKIKFALDKNHEVGSKWEIKWKVNNFLNDCIFKVSNTYFKGQDDLKCRSLLGCRIENSCLSWAKTERFLSSRVSFLHTRNAWPLFSQETAPGPGGIADLWSPVSYSLHLHWLCPLPPWTSWWNGGPPSRATAAAQEPPSVGVARALLPHHHGYFTSQIILSEGVPPPT